MKRITIPQQHLKFMGFQVPAGRRILFRPPVEPAFGQPFLTHPEPLTVIA
jgi:hypothetical protein